jgi:hypothetical protein
VLLCGIKIVAQPNPPIRWWRQVCAFGISSGQSTESVKQWLASRWFAKR